MEAFVTWSRYRRRHLFIYIHTSSQNTNNSPASSGSSRPGGICHMTFAAIPREYASKAVMSRRSDAAARRPEPGAGGSP